MSSAHYSFSQRSYTFGVATVAISPPQPPTGARPCKTASPNRRDPASLRQTDE